MSSHPALPLTSNNVLDMEPKKDFTLLMKRWSQQRPLSFTFSSKQVFMFMQMGCWIGMLNWDAEY
jgi:hypothetical protein